MSSDEESIKSRGNGAEELHEEEYVVEKVVAERVVDGSRQFLIKWRGYPDSDNTWEPEEHCDCADLIAAFRAAKKKKQPEKKTTKKKQPGVASSTSSNDTKRPFSKTTTKKRKRIDESGSEDEPVVISDSEEDRSSGQSKRKRGRQVTTSRGSSKPKKPLSDDEVDDEEEAEEEDQNANKSKPNSKKEASEEEELLYSDYSATSEKVKQTRNTKKDKSSANTTKTANKTANKVSTGKNGTVDNDETDDESGARAAINSLLDEESMENGLEPEKIIGATEVNGELYYLIKWKNMNKADLISAKIAQLGCPQTVIAFLTERLSWEGHLTNDTPTNATTTTTPSTT